MKKYNFTKATMVVIYILFVLGALMGTALVIFSAYWDMKLGLPVNSSMFIAYAAYLGTPISVAIGFYAWKSKAENVLKINKSECLKNNEDLLTTIANMNGGY